MTLKQLFVQTALTFVAASFGAVVGAFLARRTERFKHLQELRSTAYADFLCGFARVGRAQQDGNKDERSRLEELEGRAIVTDSRSRIAIYGGHHVVAALSKFVSLGTQTLSPEGMQAFAELCRVMRDESGREHAAVEDIKRVLFS